MPVNAFAGTHGWGYDGVLLVRRARAVRRARTGWYGSSTPATAAVWGCSSTRCYNHLGPSGQLPAAVRAVPQSGRATPGAAASTSPDAGSDEVRRYIIDCALRWMRDFHVDGLRLDAVHAMVDTTAIHILEELSAETEALSAQLGRPLSLIAESDLNDPRLITPQRAGGYGLTAQWDDDIHHALHTAVSGERQGYYADFGSLERLAETLTERLLPRRQVSSFRSRRHGRPLDRGRFPGTGCMAYTQTHDQVGNRALGDRPSGDLTPALLGVGAALAFMTPFTANAVHG